MGLKILASRAVPVQNTRATCNVVILDGDGIHKAEVGDVFTVGPVGAASNGCAQLKLARAGWFPMARVVRLQTSVGLDDLVGMGSGATVSVVSGSKAKDKPQVKDSKRSPCTCPDEDGGSWWCDRHKGGCGEASKGKS